jgi:hypothetical protein
VAGMAIGMGSYCLGHLDRVAWDREIRESAPGPSKIER